jgi:hypothetical protein
LFGGDTVYRDGVKTPGLSAKGAKCNSLGNAQVKVRDFLEALKARNTYLSRLKQF